MNVPSPGSMAKTAKNVKDTKQLKGTASDSLSGSNTIKPYTTSGSGISGAKGGLPSRK